MYHGLNNYKFYLRLKQDVEVAVRSFKQNLKLYEAYMMSARSSTEFDTVQCGILLTSLEITAKALMSAINEEIQLYNARFEYGLDLID